MPGTTASGPRCPSCNAEMLPDYEGDPSVPGGTRDLLTCMKGCGSWVGSEFHATPPDALTADERGMVERVRVAPSRERPDGRGNYVLVQFSQSDRDALLALVARLEKRLAEVEAEAGRLSAEKYGWEVTCQNLRDELKAVKKECDRLDASETQLVGERYNAAEWADKLAYAVAPDEVIGEHSNLNNPWQEAYDLLTPDSRVKELESQLAARAAGPVPEDDAELVTEEWLFGIGFGGIQAQHGVLDLPMDNVRGWHLFLRYDLQRKEFAVMQYQHGHVEATGLGLTRAPSKTRGDVRRLLAALGISLSPPGAGRG